MAEAADLIIETTESVFLNGYYRNAGIKTTVPNVKGIDNRIVDIPSGSLVELLKFSSSLAGAEAGTIQSDKLAYLRVSNLEATGSVYVKMLNNNSTTTEVKLLPKTSYTLYDTYSSGSAITSISAYVGGDATGNKNIEYFLATK